MHSASASRHVTPSKYVRLRWRVAAYCCSPWRLLLMAGWLVAACCLPALAQTPNIQYTKNATDSKLRGDLKVNPSTLALEFQLPIASYPGRTGVNAPVTISYSSSVWRIAYQGYNPGQYTSSGQPVGNGYSMLAAIYAEHSRAGWTSSLGFPVVDTWSNSEAYDQFGSPTSNTCPLGCFVVDRVLIRMPDGSTHELRSGDQPIAVTTNPSALPDDLYAVDGSRLRYQRSTQTLFMPDGSRYLIATTQYVDRNGNMLTGGNGVTDTLGRSITPPPFSSVAGDYTYTPLGTTGAYTFKWRALNAAGVMTTSQPLAYYADGTCPGSGGSNSPRLFTSGGAQSTCYQNGAAVFNPVVLYQVVLPTGQAYTFTYNVYGEIDKAQLPTGGYERYEYGPVSGVSSGQQPYTQSNRGVVKRWVSASGSGADEVLWQYSDVGNLVSITAPDNSLIERYQYVDTPMGGTFGYSANGARAGLAYDERYYSAPDASNVRHMLRRKLTDWAVTGSNATAQFSSAQQYANRNPRMVKEVELLLDTGGNALAKTTTYGYDTTYQFTTGVNQTSVNEYDYVAVDQNTAQTGAISVIPAPAQPVRVTETTYLDSNISYRQLNILGLPTSVTVKNGAGTVVAQTTASYDEPAYQLGNTYGAVTQWAAPAGVRGNATTVSRWLDTAGSYVQTHAQYDQCGSVVGTWDANGNKTQTDYSSTYAYAYPTTVTTAAPNPATEYGYPAGTFGSTTGISTSTSYDFNTGLVTSTTDANGKTTTLDYSDPLNRLKKVDRPDGGRTTYTYVDSAQCGAYVEARTLLDAAGRETDSYQFFDGLGRPFLSESYDGQDASNIWLRVDTRYDSMGRVSKVSNPYRSSGCGAAPNPSGRWTTTAYDDLGRVKSATTPDGAAVTTAYVGNAVTVTDQAGRKRSSVSDALGRLTQITEDPTTGGLNYLTTYAYDALGNLRKVSQGGQARFFMYDSLSRLIRAKNPEQGSFTAETAQNADFPALTDSSSGTSNGQWSVGYKYDAVGNLVKRKDARDVVTSYTYDHLNRNIITSYAAPAGSAVSSTPEVRRYYDNATSGANGLGRPYWSQAVGVSAAVFDTYDAMGRPTQVHQSFWVNNAWGQPFNAARSYDKAGNVASQTYPSGRTVSYGYDGAGRINNFTGNLGDGVTRTYSTAVTYSELGGIQQEQFGTATPLYNKRHYNVRGQLYDLRLSSVAWSSDPWNWNRGALVNYYATADLSSPTNDARADSGPDNNGNLIEQRHWVPGNDSVSTYSWTEEHYTYDALNRLKTAAENHGSQAGVSGQDSIQTYDYDRFGNRTINQSRTAGAPATQFELSPQTNQEVAEPSNRLYAPGDSGRGPSQKLMRYDPAGNLTYDSYTGQGARVYDAENRMTQAQDVYQNWSAYTYDADGQRVKRLSANQETWQVYGIGGELLSEYRSGSAPMTATKEYGYRGGELLVTMSSGDDQRLKRFVTNLYYGALQRDPTPQELQDKSNQLADAGVQGQAQLLQKAKDIARSLFTQTAYETSPYRPDSQYVADLYYAYLQRAPDDSGLNWWASQIPSVGRSNVCNGFQDSTEFATLVSTLYGTATSDNQRAEQFVTNFYLGAYGRFPTSTELQQGRDDLNSAAAQGQDAVKARAETFGRTLFASQVTDLSISAQQFVTNLYEGFLQRGPDAGGLSFWTGQAGTTAASRQNVLTAFATCGPFRELSGTLYRETFWLVADHLGTPRMVVDKSGTLAGIKRHDYLPFGEEIGAGVGGRTTNQGYSQFDGNRKKWAKLERDDETGLDYAQARYYSSATGRFTSPDEFTGGPDELYFFVDDASANPTFYADLTNPQSLNKYQYAYNNPLRYIDPEGHEADDQGRKPAPGMQIPVTVPITEPIPIPIIPSGPDFPDPNLMPDQAVPPPDTQKRNLIDLAAPLPKPEPPDVNKSLVPEGWTPDAHLAPLPKDWDKQPPNTNTQPPPSPSGAKHRRNRRKSNEEKHEGGDRRRAKDQGGEKADPRRQGMPWHKKRPDKWKGPWPPRPNPPKKSGPTD